MSRVRRRDSNAAELSPRPRRARPSSNRASLASRSRRRATNASSASSSMSSRARADARVGGAVASSSSRRHRDGEKPLRDATNARASAEIDARDVEAQRLRQVASLGGAVFGRYWKKRILSTVINYFSGNDR